MTVLAYKPLQDDLTIQVATFVYPPGTFTVGEVTNRHPIRVFQMNSSLMSCPKNMFLIMAIMQLDGDVDSEQAKAPFYAFIEKIFPELTKQAPGEDPFAKSAIEIVVPEQPPSQVEGTEVQQP